MLISHEYQFIFIKTRKTAGTSIEIFLSEFLGLWDVITPISPEDELLRIEQGTVPQNYLNAVHVAGGITEWNQDAIVAMQKNVNIVRQFYNHCPASEIRKTVGERIWNSYYKFCFERNPWDRVASEYNYRVSKNPELQETLSFENFIHETKFSINYPLYMENNLSIVDDIFQFESLQENFHKVCQRLNIPFDGKLPRAKSMDNKTSKMTRKNLTPKMQAIIAQVCEPEIKLLGYDFDQQ